MYVQADRERKNDAGRVNPAWQCIKVHREGGTVTITTQRNSDNIVVVTVQNTSTGVYI